MQWPCRTCPFGLPDEAECPEHLILHAIGYSLRETTTDITHAPLPSHFVVLLRKLEKRERSLRAEELAARRQRIRGGRLPTGGRRRVAAPEPTLIAAGPA